MPPQLRRGAAILLLLLLSPVADAQDLTDDSQPALPAGEHFAAGSAAFARGDYALALAEFQAAIRAGSTGPAAHYNAAVCHYRLGDYPAAEAAFRELGTAFPAMQSLADYNLGLALVRLNRIDPARDAFLRAAAADDEEIATLAQAMLARLPEPPAGITAASRDGSWIGQLDFNLGHDDNVALVDPLGLPAGQSTDSPFAELSVYVAGPFRADHPWQFAASAFVLDYTDADNFDQSGLSLGVLYRRQAGQWGISAGPEIGRTYIDGKGFEEYVAATVGLRRFLSGIRATVDFELRHDETDEIESQYGFIAGDRDGFRARLDKELRWARLVVDYRIRHDDRAGDGVSANSVQYGIILLREFSPRWLGDLALEYRDRQYDRLDPVRDEERAQARIRAVRRLESDWRLTAEMRYADNDSTDGAYSYERLRFSIGAGKSF
jgi:tetratricopeptide (TPR) repeat protein